MLASGHEDSNSLANNTTYLNINMNNNSLGNSDVTSQHISWLSLVQAMFSVWWHWTITCRQWDPRRHVLGGGHLANFIHSVIFPFFDLQRTGYILHIIIIFDGCRRRCAVATHVNFVSKILITFVKLIFFLTAKLANGGLITPTTHQWPLLLTWFNIKPSMDK